MNLIKASYITVLITLAVGCKHSVDKTDVAFKHNPLIEADELTNMVNEDSVVVIDMRKKEEYQKGHIPGSVNIWRTDIQTDTLPYSGMISSKKQMETLLGNLGISNNHFLVIYDDKSSCDAARLWWALDFYGFDRTALLHGGIKAWSRVGQLTQTATQRSYKNFSFPENYSSSRFVDLEALKTQHNHTNMVIIDSRSIEEYNGYYKKTGAYDSGRIPGSIHIDWASNVDMESQRFKNINDIRANYSMIDSLATIAVYCHSGVRSAHTTFVLTQLLGYKNVKNYDGSWTEWSYHKLPLERETVN